LALAYSSVSFPSADLRDETARGLNVLGFRSSRTIAWARSICDNIRLVKGVPMTFRIGVAMTMAIAVVSAEAPNGWRKSGNQPDAYEIGIDTAMSHGGKASGYIKSVASVEAGFGTMMQTISADQYRGKKVRMSAFMKTSGANEGAFLWLRIDSTESSLMDNMNDRKVRGSEGWRLYELVLPVSESAVGIAFGLGLSGDGQAWIDDVRLEVVSAATPRTGNRPEQRPPPQYVEMHKKALSDYSSRSALILNGDFER
jgi:hypothetical protein